MSLEKWKAQRELGASFREVKGKILVRDVDPGSPAWEAGLTPDDEIVAVVSANRNGVGGFLFNPKNRDLAEDEIELQGEYAELNNAGIVQKLNAEPNRQYIFFWKHDDKEQKQLTTVRQRPLWRFFPMAKSSGNDWVMWRWRNFYYDTSSAVADTLVGWHLNALTLDKKPKFYPLEYFRGADDIRKDGRGGFHRPDKVWPFVARAIQEPDKVIFPDIEPPEVVVKVVKEPGKKTAKPGVLTDLELSVSIKPRGTADKQKLARVIMWLDDYRYDDPPTIVNGIVDRPNLVVPRGKLRHGDNVITVQCYNAEGGRGQAAVTVDYNDGTKLQSNLYALCVGINDYKIAAKGFRGIDDLSFSKPDAQEMDRVFRQQSASRLYIKSNVDDPLLDKDATAKKIEARLLKFENRVKPDDWFILFLSGHGDSKDKGAAGYEPGSFYYICHDSAPGVPKSILTSRQLYDLLAKIPCRKLVILDTCRSGDVASNPLRDLTRDGIPMMIFSSCAGDQSSLEPIEGKGRIKHGFFTQSMIEALTPAAAAVGVKRNKSVTAFELARSIQGTMKLILKEYRQPGNAQTPVFFPPIPPVVPILCKP